MAGHSKWANIKHKKAAVDKQRGKVWTKLIREVTVAAREGGGDPGTNPRLRLALDKAYGANMPKDTVERAIKRGAGADEMENYEEIRYEGYGPGGVAVMLDCMSDNRNRTASEVRHAFSKGGGNLGTSGSVAYMFKKTGIITFEPGSDENRIMELALESGAEDLLAADDGSFEVITQPDDFVNVKEALEAAGFTPAMAEVTMRPDTLTALDSETAQKLLALIERLEDLDDVQDVYSNADIPDEVMEALA